MGKILFAWVGRTDVRSSVENNSGDLGPIAQAASVGGYARLILLNNYGQTNEMERYVDWLKGRTESMIDMIPVSLPNPTDFSAIYVAARQHVETVMRCSPRSTVPVFHLSPGTPAMAAVWIMLSKGRFLDAQLIQSSREKGVERVDMPFNIAAEFIPDMKKGTDQRLVSLACALPDKTEFNSIIHRCIAMKKVVAQAHLISLTSVPVLIEGETGTGKELFARAIHKQSERGNGPFVAVNCGAIPRELFEAEFFGYKKGAFTGAESEHAGYFEQADHGTLFLDELGELPLDAQVKILRILNDGIVRRLAETRERTVDVRIIAATNRNLLQEVASGSFRADLFYRLAVAMLKLPPLREREGDLSLLIDSMLEQVNKEMADNPGYKGKKFSANAKNLMVQHSWPGNAREMFNTIMRICVWCQGSTIHEDEVRQSLLPNVSPVNDHGVQKTLERGFQLQNVIGGISSEYIRRALSETGGNKSKAAKLLGFKNYQTLNNWMAKYGINA